MGSLLKIMTVSEQAYFKGGFFGFSGTGKTYTAALIAKGIHEMIGNKKPVAFYDTEVGSDYIFQSIFQPAGIALAVHKSRSFKQLIQFLDEAMAEDIQIVIVDSITHIWREFCEAYCKANKTKRLRFHDWAPLKEMWYQEFTTRYLNSPMHFIFCGRAGYEYDMEVTENGGYKEPVKTGTRLKAETETGYEASLLVEMERFRVPQNGVQQPRWQNRNFVHRAYILKDRFDLIDGKEFDNPTFEDFLPHVKALNIGGEHHSIDTKETSEELFPEGDTKWREKLRQKKIAIEELYGKIDDLWPGTSAVEKKLKRHFYQAVFGYVSKTRLEEKEKVEKVKFALDVAQQAEDWFKKQGIEDPDRMQEIVVEIKEEIEERGKELKEPEKEEPGPPKAEEVETPKQEGGNGLPF